MTNPATKLKHGAGYYSAHMDGRAGRIRSDNAEIAYCRSVFNNSNGGQKVKHGRRARVPKR